jgi:hypothetical protein
VAEALETSDESVLWLKEHCGLPYVMINRTQWRVPWKALNDWLLNEAARRILSSLPADDGGTRAGDTTHAVSPARRNGRPA